MYVFLDNITFRYKGAQASVLDGLSLFVQSGEIVAIVGPAGAGKTTLLRYVGKRSDGQGGVHIGSDGYESETEPGVIRGWRFSGEGRRVPARVAVGKMAGGVDPALCVSEHGDGRIPPRASRRFIRARGQRLPVHPFPRRHGASTGMGGAAPQQPGMAGPPSGGRPVHQIAVRESHPPARLYP
jgi:energy-coupling factor transporter ATP-binding protein EcfA2